MTFTVLLTVHLLILRYFFSLCKRDRLFLFLTPIYVKLTPRITEEPSGYALHIALFVAVRTATACFEEVALCSLIYPAALSQIYSTLLQHDQPDVHLFIFEANGKNLRNYNFNAFGFNE